MMSTLASRSRVAVVARSEEDKKLDIFARAGKSRFTRLVAAVKAADLVDTLKGKGPFTLFAPTDGAFEALGEEKFAALLIDTDRFGTSLGPALKTHARYLRIRFRQSAQEKARKVAVKLIFPVFFLIFPSVILVTLGPAVILLMTQMKSLIGQ